MTGASKELSCCSNMNKSEVTAKARKRFTYRLGLGMTSLVTPFPLFERLLNKVVKLLGVPHANSGGPHDDQAISQI